MKSKKGIIYIATNLINGKQYVGQTSRSLNERINQHIKIKHQTHFESALNKHGLNNFYIFKIEYPREELNDWEQYYIKMFNTFNTSNGYNHTSGGNVFEMSDATKKKLSELMTGKYCGEDNPMFGRCGDNHPMFGRHHSKNSKNLMSIATSGENNSMFGKHGKDHPMFGKYGKNNPNFGSHRSKETLKKMSINNSGENHPRSKLTNEKVEHIRFLLWENILSNIEIGKIFGVTHRTISNIKRNKSWVKVT
jgi:group I intron endonuclease